jgi:acyl-CoA dehydrogenase
MVNLNSFTIKIDKFGAKAAKDEIAMIKVVTPNVAATVTDRAIQIYGGEGVSQDTLLTLK